MIAEKRKTDTFGIRFPIRILDLREAVTHTARGKHLQHKAMPWQILFRQPRRGK